MSALAKYLERHAEPEAAGLAERITEPHEHALIVPAFNEPAALLLEMAKLCARNRALAVFVVNRHDAAGVDETETTRVLLDELSQTATGALVIDRVSLPLPRKQAVGVARKLGSDVAAHLIHRGLIRSPWLRQTDADVTLPDTYFTGNLPERGTVLFDHRHVAANASLRHAVLDYDEHLAYYQAGLAFAGSRYAYTALGSIIAIHAETYAQVRGFPKKNAGEDFYLLNKATKIAPIHRRPEIVVEVAARASDRVPFGTGPALARIADQHAQGERFRSYHPGVFRDLKALLDSLTSFARTSELDLDTALAADLDHLGWARVQDTFTSKYPAEGRRLKAIHDWFDALKTLRFVHRAETRWPGIPLDEARDRAPFSWRASI